MDGNSKGGTPHGSIDQETLRKGAFSPDHISASMERLDLGAPPPRHDHSIPDGSVFRDERRRLSEGNRSFQERLDQQTHLIAQVQDQLKDSQKRIADMEAAERATALASLELSTNTSPKKLRVSAYETADDMVLKRLSEEQERNSTLNDINMTLRRELDETKMVSATLTGDLLRVTEEYDRMRRDTQNRSEEFKNTEKLYLERLAQEHRQMLKLWSSFQQLRRDYVDCRSITKRGLNSMASELQRVWNGSAAACQKYEEEMRKNEKALELAAKDREAMDKALRAMEKENMQLQNTVGQLQAQVTKMEQTHAQRRAEYQRHRSEVESEFSKIQAERQNSSRKLEILEKTYNSRLATKDAEIKHLQERINYFWKIQKDYFSKSILTSQDVAQLHAGFSRMTAGMEDSLSLNENSSLPFSSPPGSPAKTSTPKRPDSITKSAGANKSVGNRK